MNMPAMDGGSGGGGLPDSDPDPDPSPSPSPGGGGHTPIPTGPSGPYSGGNSDDDSGSDDSDSPDPENGRDLSDRSEESEEENTVTQHQDLNQMVTEPAVMDPGYDVDSAPGADRGDNDSPSDSDETAEMTTTDDRIDLGQGPAGGTHYDLGNNESAVVDNPFGNSGVAVDNQDEVRQVNEAISNIADQVGVGDSVDDSGGSNDSGGNEGNQAQNPPSNIPDGLMDAIGSSGPDMSALLPAVLASQNSGGGSNTALYAVGGLAVFGVLLAVVL